MVGPTLELVRELLVQACVAALGVEALVRAWPSCSVGVRLRLRCAALGLPLALLPVFQAAAAFRRDTWFLDERALFSSADWNRLRLFGVGSADAWMVGMVLAGLVLFAVDVLPWWLDRHRVRRLGRALVPDELRALVAHRARALGTSAPTIEIVAVPHPLLACTGLWRPRLIVSEGALRLLDAAELDGAVAHELAHLVRRDVLLGLGVLLLRAAQAWSPVAQVLARGIALDLERRADAVAARATRQPAALASALLKVYRLTGGRGAVDDVLLGAAVRRGRARAVEDRCRRLLEVDPEVDPVDESLRWAGALVGLAVILFFVS